METIKKDLYNNTRDLLGRDSYNPITIKSVEDAVKNSLKNFEYIRDFKVETPKLLWETWSFKQKVTWFWRNKVTDEAYRYRKLYCIVFREASDIYREFPLELWERIKLPYWALENPKSIYVVSTQIQPIMPLETINITFKV
jgi:hypothetical protein